MTMPFGTYITPNRAIGLAAVFWSAVNGGTIASRSGSASVAPRPRNIVRRGIAFLVISIVVLWRGGCGARAVLRPLTRTHRERRAGRHTQNDRRPSVPAGRGAACDLADCRHVVRLETSPEGVSQQLLRE